MRPQFRTAALVSLLLFSLSALCQFPNPKVYLQSIDLTNLRSGYQS